VQLSELKKNPVKIERPFGTTFCPAVRNQNIYIL